MSQTVEKLAAAGQLTAEQVERIGRNVADFIKAAKEDPELHEKVAFLGLERLPWKQIAGNTLAQVAGAGALALGAKAVNKGYGAIVNPIEKAKGYKAMMADNPELSKHDPKVVQRAYNTLFKFNPEYASDPLVSGQFVRGIAETARVPLEAVNSIVQAKKNMSGNGLGALGMLPTNMVRVPDYGTVDKSQREQQMHPHMMNRAEGEARGAHARADYYEGLTRQQHGGM